MTASPFDAEALKRLKLAAEDIAFLSGRGYARPDVKAFVAKHRALSPDEEALLERAVCSEPQYRARAIREMLPEDIARRPLLVDAHDLVDAVTTALAGGALLEGLDQTMQPITPGGAPEHVDDALARVGPLLREMRPSKTKWILDVARADAGPLGEKLLAAAKKWKVAVEIEEIESPKSLLRKSANVVTNDPSVIDACKSWCNLAGPVIATIEDAQRVKLQ